MAQTRKIQTAPTVAFRYSPGDGHTYTWDGSTEYAARYWHGKRDDGTLSLVLCPGERVPMDGAARTATGFAAAVDRWRTARALIRLPELLASGE